MEKFKNYGDVNFFDGGCLVREVGETEFEVIKCNYDCDKENSYFLTHDIIDITDSWIDREKVESYTGVATDNAMFASDVISYYGTQDCEGVMHLSKNGVIDYMEKFKECIEYNFFSENFDSDCRNVTAEVTRNNGSVFRCTRDTLEDVIDYIDYFTDYRLEAGDTLKIIEM